MSRYGGAYEPKEDEAVDMKAAYDAKSHDHCTKAFAALKECEARIEEKGTGTCTGWYMDYVHCVDHHTSKTLFKALM